MHRIIRLAVLLVAITLSLYIAAPVLADPPEPTECTVQPVIGGPSNAELHAPTANVTIPANNPAIRWDPKDIMPGQVFVPGAGG